jgi:hypothetical protein
MNKELEYKRRRNRIVMRSMEREKEEEKLIDVRLKSIEVAHSKHEEL